MCALKAPCLCLRTDKTILRSSSARDATRHHQVSQIGRFTDGHSMSDDDGVLV